MLIDLKKIKNSNVFKNIDLAENPPNNHLSRNRRCYIIFSTNSNSNSNQQKTKNTFVFHSLLLLQICFISAPIPKPFHKQTNFTLSPFSMLSSLTVSPSPPLSFLNTPPFDIPKLHSFSSKTLFHFPKLLSCGTRLFVLIPLLVFLMGLMFTTQWFVLVLSLMIILTLLF